ncbi:hypothetical protein CK203_059216 [Vitis vinifera]|uniref:Retrotransposon Copia-like N-terminal domain-containing protein n=1 Tax=Vitis vinifera TaxID=29760 RepID=A0A438GHZ2_VITVI|nr:hypothetical protein CK203_059216 [Vitis vinifera]
MAGDDEQPPLPPPKREMNSPFFLGTGDRPGDFITPTRLRGDNYDDWASDIHWHWRHAASSNFWKALSPDHNLHIPNLIGTPSMQYPLPSLDRAYQLVIQDERVRLAKAVTEDKPAEVLGFAVRTGAGRGRGKTERPVCSHCKKTGHETSTCCRQQAGRGLGSARANAASSTIGASSTKSSTDQLFTPEQWKALAGLIGNAQVPDDRLNVKFDTKSWIIDTGATHHVTGDLSWLFDTIALFECPVGLPNGESVVATQSGSDHTRELIGTGVRRNGLYYFGGAEGDSVQHVLSTTQPPLWNCGTKGWDILQRK